MAWDVDQGLIAQLKEQYRKERKGKKGVKSKFCTRPFVHPFFFCFLLPILCHVCLSSPSSGFLLVFSFLSSVLDNKKSSHISKSSIDLMSGLMKLPVNLTNDLLCECIATY